MQQGSFLAELKRRNVHRAAAAYVALGWLLTQVADTLLPAFGYGDRAMRGLVIALAVLFVPAMLLAWAFELTPEGLKRARDVVAGGPLALRTNRLLDRAIIVLLSLGLAYFAIDKFVLAPSREAALVSEAHEQGKSAARLESFGDKSIVVLPFANLSSDPEQEYLSDGLAEELLNLLAKIPELRVISRSSAFSYKGKDVKLSDIAQELNVAHVLEGSVRRSGNRLRITAQLIDARTDTHLWSEVYDRELADVFDIQDDIAARVAKELQIRLLGDGLRQRRVDPQAYLLFLQGRQLISEGKIFENYSHILGKFESALALDPTLVDAWIGISRLNFLINMHSGADPPPPGVPTAAEARRLALLALDRAAEVDPASPLVIGFRGFQRAVSENDFAGAALEIERALALAPNNPDILLWAAYFARTIRRPEIALALTEHELEQDPLCADCEYRIGESLFEAGRYAEVEASILRRRAKTGRSSSGWYRLGRAALMRGDALAALAAFDSAPQDDQARVLQLAGRAMALHALGRTDDARVESKAFEKLISSYLEYTHAELCAMTDRPDCAIDILETMFPTMAHAALRGISAANPMFRALQGHPRWEALLRLHSISPEVLEAVRFEVDLPVRTPVKDPPAQAP